MEKNFSIDEARKVLDKYLKRKQTFNIFTVLRLENYEIRHSNFLAWLLDPKQTHGLGDTFLKKFIEKVNSKLKNKKITYKGGENIKVYREQDNIDILVFDIKNDFLILIENKINSKQHDNQLDRYASLLNIKFDDFANKIKIYLKPQNDEIIPEDYDYLSYKDVLDVITDIMNYVQNPEVKIFLEHYLKVLSNLYNKFEGISLIDVCLKLQQSNLKLNYEEMELVLKMANQRRYDIMKALFEVLSASSNVSECEQKIYKISFKLNYGSAEYYEFDNTNTRDNSQIKFIQYFKDSFPKTTFFLDNNKYDEIFYTYGENSYQEIKNKLSVELKKYIKDTLNHDL